MSTRDIESIKQVERSLRAADEHKAVLLHDINHRVKNSLASVAGLLELRRMEIGDPGANSAMGSSIRELAVLSHVFDRLHQSTDNGSIPERTYLEDLCNDLRQSVVGNRITLRASIDEAIVTMDRAISLGLIVNELVANALKYAFPEERGGEIAVRLHSDQPASFCLEVADDGVGFSADKPEGTGCALVGQLAWQLGGNIEWRRSPGTAARIRFPSVADAA